VVKNAFTAQSLLTSQERTCPAQINKLQLNQFRSRQRTSFELGTVNVFLQFIEIRSTLATFPHLVPCPIR
jgi:hypothetical protein